MIVVVEAMVTATAMATAVTTIVGRYARYHAGETKVLVRGGDGGWGVYIGIIRKAPAAHVIYLLGVQARLSVGRLTWAPGADAVAGAPRCPSQNMRALRCPRYLR